MTGILGLFLNLNLNAQPVPIPVPALGEPIRQPKQKTPPPPKPGEKRGPETPNIILIVADDLGWGILVRTASNSSRPLTSISSRPKACGSRSFMLEPL